MSEDLDQQPEDDELGADVVEYVTNFADRVAEEMLAAPDPRAAVELFAKSLLEDGGLTELLGRAFDDGKRDALVSAARFAEADGPSVTWEGVDGGEREMLWREGHACTECAHAVVCVVQRSLPVEALVQIRRCLFFIQQGE